MIIDISKSCSDFLRSTVALSGAKLKASHSREMVSVVFGYRSHAAQMTYTVSPMSLIKSARFFVPDLERIERRRNCLKDLPTAVPRTRLLAESIVEHMTGKAPSYFSSHQFEVQFTIPYSPIDAR